jgi:hypothetical protein
MKKKNCCFSYKRVPGDVFVSCNSAPIELSSREKKKKKKKNKKKKKKKKRCSVHMTRSKLPWGQVAAPAGTPGAVPTRPASFDTDSAAQAAPRVDNARGSSAGADGAPPSGARGRDHQHHQPATPIRRRLDPNAHPPGHAEIFEALCVAASRPRPPGETEGSSSTKLTPSDYFADALMPTCVALLPI